MMTTVARRAPQPVGQIGDRREIEHGLVDDVTALGIDADGDFLRPLLDLLGVCLGQRDLQFGNPLVRRRHHQENQNDEQNVDQRNEVDLGIVPGAGATKVHMRSG
jgi:hypothetical protein